jgi:plastocyanin
MTDDALQTRDTTANERAARLLRTAGAGLLLATGGIHLDLYLTGYRHIPTIGVLFLLQVAGAFILAVAALVSRHRSVSLLAAGFAASTLGGYVLSLWIGLFGFDEVRTTAGIVAGAIEVAAFVGFGAAAAFGPAVTGRDALGAIARRAIAPLGALATLALVLAVGFSSGQGRATSDAQSHGAATAAAVASGSSEMKVSIRNFAFVPATFAVAPGEKIVVTNHDSVTHTFTANPGSTPRGTFNSGDIAPGMTVVVTAPSKPGTYGFYCQIHPFMTGTLTVR